MIHIIYISIIIILILVVWRLAWQFRKMQDYNRKLAVTSLTVISERDKAVALLKKHRINIKFE